MKNGKTTGDVQARAWQVTINNPGDKDLGHEKVREILQGIPSLEYFCMCDERGMSYHTHIYLRCRNPLRFTTLANRFQGKAHLEAARGSAADNIHYIKKEGKWADSEKKETSLPETFEEYGVRPRSRQGHRSDLDILYGMIKDGLSKAEILERNPDYIRFLHQIDEVAQALREEQFKNTWRDIDCIYVYGETSTNKTRTYMEKYGYDRVYRITNYAPGSIWDGYRGQDVVIFEEYRSQIQVSELLTWTEGYPNCCLRARYRDKVACFTRVVFISNIALEEQYPNIQKESPATWRAFLRRIKRVYHHTKEKITEYASVQEYFHRDGQFQPVPPDGKPPFDDDTDADMPFA